MAVAGWSSGQCRAVHVGVGRLPASLPSRLPGTTQIRNNSCGAWVRASAGGRTALGGLTCPTKVPGEGINPCTQSSFTTKNVFDVLQKLSDLSHDQPDRRLKLQMGCLSPLPTSCTSR